MIRYILFGVSLGILAGDISFTAVSGSAAGQNAQPPKKTRVEEEEQPEKSKVPKKVEEIEPKGDAAPTGRGKFDFAKEIAESKEYFVRSFLERISIPFDNLVPASGAKPFKIALLPERTLPDGKFSYFELNPDLKSRKGEKKELATGAGFSLQPYEEIVLEEVNQILDSSMAKKLSRAKRDELTELCVQVLQATRQTHASWIEQKMRTGKGWDAVDDKVRKRIIGIRRDQLQTSIDAKNWKKADELSLELNNFSDDANAQKDIYRLLLRKALDAANQDRDEDFISLRDAVNQFENLAGGKGEPIAANARERLTKRAKQYVEQAKKFEAMNKNAEAFNLLKNAEALVPDLPAVRELRAKLHDRVLYVGVARLPERMSPALARSDPERWAAELLFESLLQAVPDPELGRRYRPELAAAPPALAPLGRDFTLLKNARWAVDDKIAEKMVDARDVFGTLELIQKSPHLPCAEGLDVIDTERVRIDDPYHVRLTFRQGVFEPLGRTTFKVLPARYLKAQGKDVEDDTFAKNPFGSGPYCYAGREQEGPNREAAVFRANPYYSQRAGRFGLPNIREIRFVVPNLSTVGRDFHDGQLHLVLDVPTGDILRYTDDPLSDRKVTAYTPTLNRRIYVLAINHRRLKLQNADLRRGLSAAIDRETILADVFRPDAVSKNHHALTGPFPPKCWATPEKARKPEAALFNKALAGGLLSAAVGKGQIKLNLKYPEDDPLATRACTKIKDQIEAATKKTPEGAPLVEIELTPVASNQLWWKLEQQQDFELAYVPYDYKDDLYWLGGLFDGSAAGLGGRNYMGYPAPGTDPQRDDNDLRILLDEIRTHCNFRDKVRQETWNFHAKFLSRMPFVPLWQLDRHIIVHENLEMFLDKGADALDPKQLDLGPVFTGVENWRLK